MRRPNSGTAVPAVVPLHITVQDIAAMEYWLNEAAMADVTRQNAICFALERVLCDGGEVHLRDASGDQIQAVVNGSDSFALPPELAVWWRRVLVGHRPFPVTAKVRIPEDLVAERLRLSLRMQGKRVGSFLSREEFLKVHAA